MNSEEKRKALDDMIKSGFLNLTANMLIIEFLTDDITRSEFKEMLDKC